MHLLDTTHCDEDSETNSEAEQQLGSMMAKDTTNRRSLRAFSLVLGIFVVAMLTAAVLKFGSHGPVSGNMDLMDTAVSSTMLLEIVPANRTYEEVFLLRPNWINLLQHGGNESTDDVQTRITDKQALAQPRQLARQKCQQRLLRFDQVALRHITPGFQDPDFPPAESSIASPGANCGDTARHLFEPCIKFNKWQTFQTLSWQMGKRFQVFDNKGPGWHDIGQGQLGNCYFLGALASLAYTDPAVIDGMFVMREKWKSNVYTTKWLLNGKVSYVEVDNHVPASNGRPFFVSPSLLGEWWPVILEKAWSKIFGNYKATEGGLWESPVMAMTRAPIDRYVHAQIDQDHLFRKLSEATQKKWPMGVASSQRALRYGLAAGHTYAVLRTHIVPRYGKVVTVYNPWRQDNYRGEIPQKADHDGLFDMSLREFHDSFHHVAVARVHNGYVDSSQLIQTENFKMTSWEFTVPFSGDFFVSVNWPSDRSVAPCEMLKPKVVLAVTKQGSKEPILGSAPVNQVSSIFAGPIRGRGTYVATVSAEFPPTDYVHEVHLVIYGPKHVTIVMNAQDAADTLMKAFGPQDQFGNACRLIHMTSRGTFELKKDKVVNGLPTYWSIDGVEFAYWFPHHSVWMVVSTNMFTRIKGGEAWSNHKAKISDLSCGCKDSANGVGGFNGVSCRSVSGNYARYYDVKCHGVKHSPLVQRYCPTACGATVCGLKFGGLSPSPSPHAEIQQKCEDKTHTGLRVGGGRVEASCDELRDYCHQLPSVQQACCATCADRAEHGLVGNGQCRDEDDPQIQGYSCTELANACSKWSSVQERCCATCKKANTEIIDSKCVDKNPPNIRTWYYAKKDCAWAKRKGKCKKDWVKEECCKTCST